MLIFKGRVISYTNSLRGDIVSAVCYAIHTDTNPWGLSGNLQSPGWQPTLYVAWYLIWWFASIGKSMVIHDTGYHTWHWISLLRPIHTFKLCTQVFIFSESDTSAMGLSNTLCLVNKKGGKKEEEEIKIQHLKPEFISKQNWRHLMPAIWWKKKNKPEDIWW